MAKKPTVTTITSGYASNTQLNANFVALRDGFDNTLSLDGSTPNSMGADLDMNSNDILNANNIHATEVLLDGVPVSATVAASSASAAASAVASAASAVSAADSLAAASDVVANIYDNKLTPEASSVVSTDDYSSFPSLAGKNAELVVAYHHGVNHGQSDSEAVALNQTTGGAAALVLNGNEASGGSVSTWATQVTIEAVADESARTFTVVGSLAGVPVTIVSLGPNAGSITLTGNLDVITSVTIDGATTGNVSVGLLRIASNIETKKSTDGGATWSAAQALGDGMTTGQYRYYYPALGVTKLGSYILVYEQVDVTTGVGVPKYRTSADGTTWSEETNMVIGGEAASLFAFYGKISVTPSGRLVLGAYLSTKQYVLVSDDHGVSWTAYLQRTESAFTTSEMSFAIVSELVWLSWIRIDNANGTLVQMKTVDGGLNWTDMGQISVLPVAGGYKSHDTTFVTLNGTRYIFLAIMSRDAGIDGLNPNTIIGKFGRVSDIVASAAGFFAGEDVLANDLEAWPRNGYPSIVVDPLTNECVMAYHTETGDRTSKVLTKGFNVAEVIYGSDEWATFTPTLTSTAGTAPAFNIQSGRWSRQGKFLDFEADIRVNGVIGWSGNLVVDLSDIGSFVFDSPVNSFATVGIIENTDLLTRGLYDISTVAQDGTLELALNHSRDELTSSALAGFEVNNDFRIKVSGRLRVK
jgi:hypothetical protein